MLKNTKRNEGFTIIEVMIVLAIAGLIMLIVFLAVPALQRNSRNTQYKNDAASLVAAATEFSNNNNGVTPAAGSGSTTGSPSTADADKIAKLAKTQSIVNLTIVKGTTSAITPKFDTATIDTGVKCPATVGGGSITPIGGVSSRAMIIVYAVEDSGGNVVAQCTES
jgi:prepilin-type N-terminal cleavage/methylation domain-containing protein